VIKFGKIKKWKYDKNTINDSGFNRYMGHQVKKTFKLLEKEYSMSESIKI
jgi:hypothetical protein